MYVGALLCGVPNDAACFVAFWQTVSNVWQFVRSASAIGSQPISWVYVGILRSVRNQFRGCSPRICGMFATCSFSVCYIFALQKYGFCRAKVWFLTCKKGVFELQKYGFCFLNVALLQFVRHAFAECSPHCCNSFATHSPNVRHIVAIRSPRIRNLSAAHSHPSATLLQSVSSAFAPHKQRCCNFFASKKPKPSMCIEEFRPPKIL